MFLLGFCCYCNSQYTRHLPWRRLQRRDSEKIRKAAEVMRLKAEDIARGNIDYATYEEVFGK